MVNGKNDFIMKKSLVYSLLAVLLVCSCQVKDENVPEAKIFTATLENHSGETKTSLNANGNVLWKQGDKVSIFAGININEQYRVTDASDGKTSASLYMVTNSNTATGTSINNNVAFYPYSSTASIAKSGASYTISNIVLPATQNYSENSFGNGAFPMAAVTSSTSDMNIHFKNILGGLNLQLKGTATITSISVTGNSNEILCGDAEVSVSTESMPSVSLTDAAAKTITLNCDAGVTLNTNTATSFIIALPPITMSSGFTVVVTDKENKQMKISTTKPQTITRSNILKMPVRNYVGTGSDDYVDLGLSVKWGTCNIGAENPEEAGDYYSWGETESKSVYDWSSYKYCNGSNTTITKYCTLSSKGSVDNKIHLEAEDDIAHVCWGDNWRMPTNAEYDELFNNCTWSWVTQNGVKGYRITGTNGNSIFLPITGYKDGSTLKAYASSGYYWSSTLKVDGPTQGKRLTYNSSTKLNGQAGRHYGFAVRPVYSDDPTSGVIGISLDKSLESVPRGDSISIVATVSAKTGSVNKDVQWSSSDTSIATVDYDGMVTAVSIGNAVITAKTVFGGFTATCDITVISPIIVTSIALDKTSASLEAGETVTLTATVKPDNATDKTVTWSTSDASIATVTNGVVTANKVGTATITAKAGDKLATCAITVVTTPVTSISLSQTSSSLKVGETVTLTATVKPDNATDKTVTWSTSDASIATVTNGVVTANKVGTATITAKAGDKSATCAIDVQATPVSSVTLNKTSASLRVFGTMTLTATVKPDDATDKTITWSSSDASVATVSKGVVTAMKTGNAIITAKAGDKSATCAVEVKAPALFSVSTDKQVKFSPGNLVKWSDSEYTFETIIFPYIHWTTSITGGTTYDAIGGRGYNKSITATPRSYFSWSEVAEGNGVPRLFTVGGVSGWRVLTQSEWTYLLSSRTMKSTNVKRYYPIIYQGEQCRGHVYLIPPDDATASDVSGLHQPSQANGWCIIQNLDTYIEKGFVILPADGRRQAGYWEYGGEYGCYHSSSESTETKKPFYLECRTSETYGNWVSVPGNITEFYAILQESTTDYNTYYLSVRLVLE